MILIFPKVAPNVSQEATGDAARFPIDGADRGGGNSQPAGMPRRLSSRLLDALP